jgi:chorismate mutase-like protein
MGRFRPVYWVSGPGHKETCGYADPFPPGHLALLLLLNRRAKLAQEVGEIKKKKGLPFYVPGREAKILSKLEELNQGPLPAESIRAIFREIISACRALEEPTKVAYLGPPATFTHLAALKHFGSSSDLHPMDSIDEVFDESQIKDFVRTHYDIADIYDAETIIEQVSLAFEPQEIFSEEEMRIVLNE